MSTAAPEVVTPTAADSLELAEVKSFLEAHEARYGNMPEPRFFLSGAAEHDRVELTEQLHEILARVVQALTRGQSVSILTRDQEITTQQAAELLGLSRPTVVRLIDDGELEATVPGTVRRKLKLVDVLDYRARLHTSRSDFIAESSEAFEDVEDDSNEVADLLKEARKAR